MLNDGNQEAYSKEDSPGATASKAVGLGLVSVASAIAGGLAMAWWYRKTIAKLQNPIASDTISDSEIPKTESKE